MSEPNEDNEIIGEIVDEGEDLQSTEDPWCGTSMVRWKPPQYSEEWWAMTSPEVAAKRCSAHSSRTGKRCCRISIEGARVCYMHGGAAKHVKAAARARLENAADRMAANLLGLAENAVSEQVRLAGTNSALDRTIGKAPTTIEIGPTEPKPWEEVFDGISSNSRASSRAARGVEDLPANAEGLGGHRTSAAGETSAPSFTQGETGDQTQPPTPSPPWAGTFETGPPPQAFDTYTTGHINDGTGWPDTPPQQPSAHKFARERGNQAANGVTREPPVRHTPSGQAREDSAATRPHHISGDDAVAEAGRLARQQKAITSPHRRYTRP